MDSRHARRGRVGRGGHVTVVAPVVFDKEVPIGRGRQHQLGKPALQRRVLVAQLMPQVDAEPAHRARGQHHRQHAVPGQWLCGYPPGAEEEGRPQHRHQQKGDAAVVPVVFQRGHGGFGRVALVHAQQPVQQRSDEVEKGHRRPQRQRIARPGHQRRARAHRAGHHQRQQPCIPLAVAVGRGGGALGLQHGASVRTRSCWGRILDLWGANASFIWHVAIAIENLAKIPGSDHSY